MYSMYGMYAGRGLRERMEGVVGVVGVKGDGQRSGVSWIHGSMVPCSLSIVNSGTLETAIARRASLFTFTRHPNKHYHYQRKKGPLCLILAWLNFDLT